MRGTLIPGVDETSTQLSAVHMEFDGIQFIFSKESSLLLTSEQNIYVVPIVSYRETHKSISIQFKRGITLDFIEDSKDHLKITLNIPKLPTSITKISIPYFLLPGVKTEEKNHSAEIVSLKYRDNDYILMLPPGTIIDSQENRFSIPIGYGKSIIRYARTSGEFNRSDPQTILSELPRTSATVFRQQVSSFLEKAYLGWNEERYNGGSGTWQMYGNATSSFQESILIAFLAESWKHDNNTYTIAYNKMQRAASLHPELLSILSAPYLGSLRDIMSRTSTADIRKSRKILEKIKSRDTSIFDDFSFLSFITYRADQTVRKELASFLPFLDYRSVSIPTSVGLLACYLKKENTLDSISSWLERFRPIVEEMLLPKLIRIKEGVFIETSPNEINVRLSVIAGSFIKEIGDREQNKMLSEIGRTLILSGIYLADENGFIPYTIFIGTATAEQSEYRFGPEEIYSYIANNPYLPSFTNLKNYFTLPTWILTISKITQIEKNEQTFSIVFRTTPERTHYIILQGISSFTRLTLFGREWRNDPGFESYVRGRHYNATTKTLMIKYNDVIPERRMTIFF